MSQAVSNKFRSILLLAFLSCTAAVFGFSLVEKQQDPAPEPTEVVKEEVSKPEKKKELCGCTRHHIKFKRDHYDRHRAQAKKLNGSLVTEDNLTTSKNLVKVKDGEGYVIDRYKLTHSKQYLNTRAYAVLQEMGRTYSEKVKGTQAEGSAFHISSLTRTKEQQRKLLKSSAGRNATKKESAHSYGASFDIYKLDNTNSCNVARKAFEEVLKQFQKDGKILLCPEGNCIHVTVKK